MFTKSRSTMKPDIAAHLPIGLRYKTLKNTTPATKISRSFRASFARLLQIPCLPGCLNRISTACFHPSRILLICPCHQEHFHHSSSLPLPRLSLRNPHLTRTHWKPKALSPTYHILYPRLRRGLRHRACGSIRMTPICMTPCSPHCACHSTETALVRGSAIICCVLLMIAKP